MENMINYQKRKNQELFKSLEEPNTLFLSKTQNYIPIYRRFFSLNETNYNSINLNHKWYISSIKGNDEVPDLLDCKIKNFQTMKTKEKDIFFKMAPLLDPYKYLIGKYDISDPKLFKLPDINSTENDTNPKFIDANNSAYVDGFFVFLTSMLNQSHVFLHGIDYFGSFLAVKNNYKLNVFDDLEYLIESDFFNKNRNVLYTIDDYSHIFQNDNIKKNPIKIEYNTSVKSNLSIKSFDEEIFENIFEDSEKNIDQNIIHLQDLKDGLVDITNTNMVHTLNNDNISTLKSSSTCSSRTSHTSSENDETKDDKNNDSDYGDGNKNDDETNENDENDENDEDNNWEDINSGSSSSDGDSYEEETIDVTISKFPVQVICMEHCENTFDDLILQNDLKPEEWYSAFMQIIMILITYQKAFAFTHNDLHTNNVMYNSTNKKFIYYYYKKKYYKVPTFGRLFKIIDFGRSIYKYDSKIFCSDSFQNGNDAATQYNTEPYFNEKKPRLEPNYSFDLCRLACSIFDYLVDDLDEIKDINKCDPIKKLVVEWCLDDNGVNLLYKNNGTDRYPDFKLYKMIARCVHNHTPQAQLERPDFKVFEYNIKNEVLNDVINIDVIPSYV
jgi:hypothetical protein